MQKLDTDICIVSTARTPQGSFNGKLSTVSAPDLASIAIKGNFHLISKFYS